MANAIVNKEFSALAKATKFPVAEVIKENYGPQGISPNDLLRVKVPAGGAQSWEIMTKQGEKSVKAIEGITIDSNELRMFFSKSFEETGGEEPPDCISLDMETGVGTPGGPCKTCPKNVWGSGKNGRGKACQERNVMMILPTDQFLPVVISAPVGSLGNIKAYIGRITSDGLPKWAVVTSFGLEKDKTPEGMAYSKILPTFVRELTNEELVAVKKYRTAILASISQEDVAGVAPVPDPDPNNGAEIDETPY